MPEENILKDAPTKQSVYEKDEQKALQNALESKSHASMGRSTKYTDREDEDDYPEGNTEQDGKDDVPDSDDDIAEDDDAEQDAEFVDKNPRTTRATMRQGGTLIFTRKRDIAEESARLQDFQIKKMLGRGAFGKVFLV